MQGTVSTGDGNASKFVPMISDLIIEELEFRPFAGTLNLLALTGVESLPKLTVKDSTLGTDDCAGVEFRPCLIGGVQGAILKPIIDGYPEDKHEIIAPVRLRTVFDITDGDTITVMNNSDFTGTNELRAKAAELGEFDAVVFCLSRNLIRLADPPDSATDNRRSNRTLSKWLQVLNIVSNCGCSIGIYSEASIEQIESRLEHLGIDQPVDVIVTHEQGTEVEQLRQSVSKLGTYPGNVLFIGAGGNDYKVARDAGVSYLTLNQINTHH